MTKQRYYRVRFKDIASIDDYYLNYNTLTKSWYIDSILENEMFRTSFTKEELEEAGFGWVFNCPVVEVKEVE